MGHSKVKMKTLIIFTFVLLTLFATIDAQCRGKYQGKVYKFKKVPRSCCKKNGMMTVARKGKPSRRGRSLDFDLDVRQAAKCSAVCPLLKALKGCPFMCHFYMCQDKCQTECPPTTVAPPAPTTGDTATPTTGDTDASGGTAIQPTTDATVDPDYS